MKYVSPVCEVEVLETEDIMNVPSTNVAGVTVFGGVDAVDHNNSGVFDAQVERLDENGDVVKDDQGNIVYDTITNGGFGLSLDYNLLNG